MSSLLHFSEHRLQEIALAFMSIVYVVRIKWLLSFKDARDKFAATGTGAANPNAGKWYSLANIAMPWVMESTRTKPFFYSQFVIFHLGVVCSISLSFIIPYLPQLLEITAVARIIQVFTAAACLVGAGRLIRRLTDPVMRLISTPDDYFSLALLTVWFVFAFLAAPNDLGRGEGIMLAYFFMTAFFLVYVPFSKISHYLYYPFTRWWLGRTLGHRGVFPLRDSAV
ncbi:MAG: hypothetical protein HY747_08370 [Elusimicrobia bacterium]|nr:hypothetical protein [Elusimicrobiota bacterium]